ncbi:rhodanese-like domain-containing protein [Halorussus sp. MSC15.2]|uniref:rhodanese-like domain-containing protein n=1 Tax=Halorussus sp. MSC15.2 TaxID=2283638 RepID=UPI0013D30ACA|nr:rhodanese-like domain-containing protein [Halorussus sp. MSC15.2]NEU58931.1 rhodanese-like domain-containing protein [Halorussus sp. MSC15.2]
MDAEISPEEVDELLDADEDVRVVDIRPEAEFDRGHIPGSENVPFHALADEIERFDGADRIVTVCPHGKASVQAARLVASYEGVSDDARVESMEGGLSKWEYGLTRSGDEENASDEGADGDDTDEPDAPF